MRTGRTVDMFLTAIMRTGKGNEYLNRSLVPRRDGSLLEQQNAKPKDFVEIGVDAEDYYKIKDSEKSE